MTRRGCFDTRVRASASGLGLCCIANSFRQSKALHAFFHLESHILVAYSFQRCHVKASERSTARVKSER
jgi:hypothetical protein